MNEIKLVRNFQTALINNNTEALEHYFAQNVNFYSDAKPQGISGKRAVADHLKSVLMMYQSQEATANLESQPGDDQFFLLNYSRVDFQKTPQYMVRQDSIVLCLTLEPVIVTTRFAFAVNIDSGLISGIKIKKISECRKTA